MAALVTVQVGGCGPAQTEDMMPVETSVATATPEDMSSGDVPADTAESESPDDSDDEEPPSGSTTSDSNEPDAEPETSGAEPDPEPATTGEAETDDGPSTDYDICIDQATSECEVCACDNCLGNLTTCEQNAGCIAIRDCARQTGCTGIECLGPCGDVINANGGPFGESAGLASELSGCYEDSCPGC